MTLGVVRLRLPSLSEAVYWRCSIKYVLRNFAKFTGKHLRQSFFFK